MTLFNSSLVFLSYCFLLVFVVAGTGISFKRSEGKEEALAHHYQTVKLTSFLSSSICRPSINKRDKKRGSLEVVHKHGPCSKFSKNIVKPITLEKILTHDKSRVDSIKSRLTTGNKNIKTSKATIPTTSGTLFKSGEYIVNVGIGTPKKTLELIMDTGSDLTWTQCQPCAGSCYSQQEPMFTPSLSTTYSNISCFSKECSSLLPSATGNLPRCSSSTCIYGIQYGDASFSVGMFAKEKLTLTNNDTMENFMFGCGQINRGDYGTTDGLLALGRGALSVVSQAGKKYGNAFSYCLPSTDSSSGYLTFGSSTRMSNDVKYTRLVTSQDSNTFYNVEFVGMTVGGTRITMRRSSTMTVDSGTVVTRLPPAAYAGLRKAFRAQMGQYPLTKPLSILDTCYDLSKYANVEIPKIRMVFGGNVSVDIPGQGVLIAASPNQMCLPFAGNEVDSDPTIFGNIQQMTMDIVYDLTAERIGFSSGGCE